MIEHEFNELFFSTRTHAIHFISEWPVFVKFLSVIKFSYGKKSGHSCAGVEMILFFVN